MRQWLVLAACAVLCGGCQTDAAGTGSAAVAPPPANYRAMVADHIRKTFKDPYSIRDASISRPIPGTSLIGRVYTVCVWSNSKNSFGAYTGVKPVTILIRDGTITGSDEQYAGLTCNGEASEPFPEIEAGGKPKA